MVSSGAKASNILLSAGMTMCPADLVRVCANNPQSGKGASAPSNTMADAGTSVDGGNEKQEGVNVDLPPASMGLERLKGYSEEFLAGALTATLYFDLRWDVLA